MDDTALIEQLRKEEQTLRARLEALKSAPRLTESGAVWAATLIDSVKTPEARDALVKQLLQWAFTGEWSEPSKSGEPEPVIPEPNVVLAGSPTLDGLRIRDAVSVYLNWCRDNGRERVTLGEMEGALLANRVVSSRGQPLRESKYPWKTLTNLLGSPDNAELWIVEMHSPEHYQRADTIGLKTPKRATVEG